MYSRRKILKGASLFFCNGGLLDQISSEGASTRSENLADFLSLSSQLTGFEGLNEDLAASYSDYLAETDPLGWNALIASYRSLKAPGISPSVEYLTRKMHATKATKTVVKSLLKLWYSGWVEKADSVPQEVRALGYEEALAWRAMELSPRGAPTGQLWQEIIN